MNRWDNYFFNICYAVAKNSLCMSRQIGAILVRDKSIVSTGYNGPARSIYDCNYRLIWDTKLQKAITNAFQTPELGRCPRQQLGLKSGEGLHLCPAVHAETNAITNAARLGVSTLGTTLYLNTQIPCKDCLSNIINAGIEEIVCTELLHYSELTKWMLEDCVALRLKVRTFDLD